MKLALTLALMLSAAGLADAQTQTLVTDEPAAGANVPSEVLSKVVVNGETTPFVGRLSIDPAGQKMQLQILKDPCHQLQQSPANVMKCMAMPVPVAVLQTPIQTRQDVCGSIYYSGSVRNPDDQSLIQIDVANHSLRRCLDYRTATWTVDAAVVNTASNQSMTYQLQN